VHVLARMLRGLGVELRRVVMILDDVDEIAREVATLAAAHDWLFTSGGVGPTHDDVTVLGVAAVMTRWVDVPATALSRWMERQALAWDAAGRATRRRSA